MLHIVAACGHADEFVNLQQREVALELRSLAIRRERNFAAAFDKCAEYIADPVKRPYLIKILSFVDVALRL